MWYKKSHIPLLSSIGVCAHMYQILLTKTDTVFPIDVARCAMQIEESLKANKSLVQPAVMGSSKSGAGIRSLRTVLAKIAPLRRAACTIVLAWKPKVSKLIEVPDVFDADCSPTQIEQGCRYSLAMPVSISWGDDEAIAHVFSSYAFNTAVLVSGLRWHQSPAMMLAQPLMIVSAALSGACAIVDHLKRIVENQYKCNLVDFPLYRGKKMPSYDWFDNRSRRSTHTRRTY
ncbi:hypothetical protein ACFX15_005617 [Malus domestica]